MFPPPVPSAHDRRPSAHVDDRLNVGHPEEGRSGELPDELARQAEIRFNARTGRGELTSWRNSLPIFLADVCEAGLEHVEVLLEHRLPLSPKRVDVVLLRFPPTPKRPRPFADRPIVSRRHRNW
jgi:hypothetical protein